jgi:hypothetical protein
MGAVTVLTPIVILAWPAFSAAVTAAAAALGYQVAAAAVAHKAEATAEKERPTQVELAIEQSELVTDQLARDQSVTVERDGVTVTFSRDARGKAALCVTGVGQTEEALRALGQELSQRVVQRHVYQRLMDEVRARNFVVVEEEVDETNAIHLKVRHWEG